ncbi:MAG: hypothetical protein HW383_834 [Candidatus Magasanikbacteria bacterium]|nr:hypothetical protein [Candidatus Magasanikbacteria bacterium]
MRIEYDRRFKKHFQRLSVRIQLLALEKEELFRGNWRDVSLHTHKLTGREEGFWAFWINLHYRIKFDFKEDGTVRFYNIGTHDDVYE